MNNDLVQIDVSKSIQDIRKEDLIEIELGNKEHVYINYSKLVSRSKYIRDKYKYSEALNNLQHEIEEISKINNIKQASIKFFFELIQESKVNFHIKEFHDLYTLSEYFDIPIFIKELDKINEKQLFRDLNFTLENLLNFEHRTKNENNKEEQETNLYAKIEQYLTTRINECLQNSKFQELSISTISRIILKSDQTKIEQNLLLDFILQSISTRFTLFKFVQFEQISDDQIFKFLDFLNESEEETKETKEIYFDYLPFNLSLIQHLRNKYDNLFTEHKRTKQELERVLSEQEQTKTELKRTKIQLNQAENEIKKTKIRLEQTEKELGKTKEELEQTQKELELINIKINNKQHLPSIVTVGGYDKYNQLGKSPNNKNQKDISPPLTFQLDPSPILSFSVYHEHSVLITSDGLLKGIGNNKYGLISSSLPKTVIDHFTEFSIKDENGDQLDPISAVCYYYGTLYMFSKNKMKERQLVLCNSEINGGDPIFLKIGYHHPVALFGGSFYLAVICSEGEIIFISNDSIKNSLKSPISAVSLPENEKASSVACCNDSIIVLSSTGRVFESLIEKGSSVLKFSEIDELKCKEIVCVSGTNDYFLAVSKEGRVFGRGSNYYGKLCLEEGVEESSTFTEILSLGNYEIKSAYAGCGHSLFETRDGKILSCGSNSHGQLFLNSEIGGKFYSPMETMIMSGATFCIARNVLSVVFIGNEPPPNMPNMRIKQSE